MRWVGVTPFFKILYYKDNMNPKPNSWYIKVGIISFLLFIQTLILGIFINQYVHTEDYFSLTSNNETFLYSGITLFCILLTYSLSIGGWDKYEEYLYVPLPIGIGIFLTLGKYNISNGLVVSIVLMLLIAYYLYKAKSLKKLLVKFEPHFVFDTSMKGLITIYAIFSIAIFMFGNNTNTLEDLNVGETMMNVTGEPIKNIPIISELGMGNEIETIVEDQINGFLIPYKSFFKPIMAIFMFMMFKFIGQIAYMVYVPLMAPMFEWAKKLGFIKIEKAMVEQEIPTF